MIVANGDRKVEGKILLVENSAEDATFFELALQEFKPKVKIFPVTDGQLAIDYLRGDAVFRNRDQFPLPSLMILDLQLPIISGLDVLRWVRMTTSVRRLPVVVFTAYEQESQLSEAYDIGVNSIVQKPFEFKQFSKTVKEIVQFWLGFCRVPVLNQDAEPAGVENS
jgi:DNA-binding response OmpR family regulator